MNTNLLNIVKQITAQNGESILADAARLKPLFADLAKNEPKPLRIAFGRCIEAGAYNALKTAPNAAGRIARKTTLAQNLRNQHGIDPVLCAEALDVLDAVLFGTASSAQQTQYQQPALEKKTLRNVLLIVAAVAAVVIIGVVVYRQHQEQRAQAYAQVMATALSQTRQKQYDQAINTYYEALDTYPEFEVNIKTLLASVYGVRGSEYCLKGNYDRAIADCNEALRIGFDNAGTKKFFPSFLADAAYALRGTSYAMKGNFVQAIADCNEALHLNPNNADARMMLNYAETARVMLNEIQGW